MKELEQIYQKRKKQLLPLTFGLAAFFIIFRVIIPQWEDVSSVSELITSKQQQVDAKEKNLQLLNSIPDQKVEDDFMVATTALPVQKDIILIYTELVDAAARANVSLGGFSVNLGGIYATEPESNREKKSIIGVPLVNILINVSGQTAGLYQFAEELYKSIPVVEIIGVNMSNNEARYNVNFFYKPITVRPSSSTTSVLEPLTQPEIDQLTQLSTWRGVSQQ